MSARRITKIKTKINKPRGLLQFGSRTGRKFYFSP
jgi:hypothetical protein